MSGFTQRGLRVALFGLAATALTGLLLRAQAVAPLPGIIFPNWLHAHSHLAFLGWVYNALYIGIVAAFLPAGEEKKYRPLFYLTQLCIAGMFIAFPLQGYGFFSILFLCVFQTLTYVFVFFLLRDLRRLFPKNAPRPLSVRMVSAAAVFLALSSAGTWALGAVSSHDWPKLYRFAVYWYMHFQYNGWMPLALGGLMVYWLEGQPEFNGKSAALTAFFRFFTWACLPALALPALSLTNHFVVTLTAWAGALLQIAATVPLLRFALMEGPAIQAHPSAKRLLNIALFAFALKTLLQTLSLWPGLAPVALTLREWVVAYLHLILLGMVTTGLLAYWSLQGALLPSARSRAFLFFIACWALSELTLTIQGGRLLAGRGYAEPYPALMLLFTIGMAAGILWLVIPHFFHRKIRLYEYPL